MKIVCGKCASEVELPKEGESPDVLCPSCGAVFRMPSLAEGETLPHPDTFPGYRIVAIVGHGGMGAVYRAVQLSMEREVAIKVLLSKYSHVPRFVARFEREATALAALSHPNIVAVIDRGRVGDTYYFVMEYVHGRTLRTLIKQGRLTVERAVDVAIQVCRALEAAHAAGVVHRDIKPGNVLCQDDGLVKVADFGIAHMVDDGQAAEGERRARLGTAKYMAPEQRGTGDLVDPRADIYALGVTLFEMLTGDVARGQPASAVNPQVPHELDAVCERAVREDRDDRYPTATALREDLEPVLAAIRRAQAADSDTADVPPPPEGPLCPACARPVEAATLVCPHCNTQLAELCFLPECDGVNPVGAERCLACNGHVELLRHRREAELVALLAQAKARAADGLLAGALRALADVLRDRHVAFGELRDQAREIAVRVRRLHRRALVRNFLTAACVLVVVAAAGVASYWGVRKLALERPAPGQGPPRTHVPTAAGPNRPATRPRKPRPKPPQRPRRPLQEYLVAITDAAWSDVKPGLRITAAAAASAYLYRPNGRDGRRLTDTLDGLKGGNVPPPSSRELHRRLFEAVDAASDMVVTRLRRHKALAGEVTRIVQRHRASLKQAKSAPQQLAVAATTMEDLLIEAEARLDPKPSPDARLLLLDATLASAWPSGDGLNAAARRLTRAGRLLVRYERRQGSPAPELLDDALARLDAAQEARDTEARLAFALEACLEALGAHAAAR